MTEKRTIMLVICLAVTTWLAALCWLYTRVLSYEALSGPPQQAPASWPTECNYKRTPGYYSLILFAHPHCPCTKASLHELAKLMSKSKELKAHVFFLKPRNMPTNWAKTAMYDEALTIPGVSVSVDCDAFQSSLFHAHTSGEAMLFSPAGQLRFSGGITAGRGHEGDNQGASTILKLIEDASTSSKSTPVFGCALQDDLHPNSRFFRR